MDEMIQIASQNDRKLQKEKALRVNKQMTIDDEDDDIYTVEHIVDKKKEGLKTFYLVKWEGFPHS